MAEKKKPVLPPQEKIEEINDSQLSQVNGGITIPTIPDVTIPTNSGNEKLGGLKLGQALKKNTTFTKSDDRLP